MKWQATGKHFTGMELLCLSWSNNQQASHKNSILSSACTEKAKRIILVKNHSCQGSRREISTGLEAPFVPPAVPDLFISFDPAKVAA